MLAALGVWAEQWTDVRPEHSDPGLVVSTWGRFHLRRESLPDRRIVVRFEFSRRGRREMVWLLIERREAELCAFDPGFGDDLVVVVDDPVIFARWHLGHIEWAAALRSGGVTVTGPADLRRALPAWNQCPEISAKMRAAHQPTALPMTLIDAPSQRQEHIGEEPYEHHRIGAARR